MFLTDYERDIFTRAMKVSGTNKTFAIGDSHIGMLLSPITTPPVDARYTSTYKVKTKRLDLKEIATEVNRKNPVALVHPKVCDKNSTITAVVHSSLGDKVLALYRADQVGSQAKFPFLGNLVYNEYTDTFGTVSFPVGQEAAFRDEVKALIYAKWPAEYVDTEYTVKFMRVE